MSGLPHRVSFAEAFRFWLKLGFISFGGPAGQIAIMHRELVDKRKWLGEERFLHALNYCMLLPGPEAQQLATYIGWLMHRTLGGIVAGVLFVLPSVFILLALSYIYAAYGRLTAVAGIVSGFKPVVVAIVIEALFKIGKWALRREVHYVIAAAAFVAIYFLHVPFPLLVLIAAVIGLIGMRFAPGVFESAGKAAEVSSEIDRAGAEHTSPSVRRTFGILAAGVILWLAPFVIVVAWLGSGSVHATEYRFFSVAAFVTFGGAYAVLAYVTQAVTAAPYAWITPAQAVDGLALAETTPGPLIMVLQFIGFMAAWNNPPDGMSPLVSGVIEALITTWVTFLPSFVFIFVGAPYIERLRGSEVLSGALNGITAAVVGVILNLALVFAAAVIFSDGLAQPDWFALAMSVGAFVALFRFKVDVLWVILAGGLIGAAKLLFV